MGQIDRLFEEVVADDLKRSAHNQRIRVMHQLKDFMFHHNIPRDVADLVLSWVDFDYSYRQTRALENMVSTLLLRHTAPRTHSPRAQSSDFLMEHSGGLFECQRDRGVWGVGKLLESRCEEGGARRERGSEGARERGGERSGERGGARSGERGGIEGARRREERGARRDRGSEEERGAGSEEG